MLSVVDVGQNGPVFDDLDAGELFEDPPLRRVVGEFGLFRFEALIHGHYAVELFDVSVGVTRHPFNQRQDRGWAGLTRAQAVAQLAVRSARFSACAGFGSPSAFLLVPRASASPRDLKPPHQSMPSRPVQPLPKRLACAARAGRRVIRYPLSYANRGGFGLESNYPISGGVTPIAGGLCSLAIWAVTSIRLMR